MDRAYALVTVKTVDDEQRLIAGIASTPETDRVGDVVDPVGAKFAQTIPLLLHHDSRLPVGNAMLKRGADGISFNARIPKIEEPGTLKTRVDEAWQSIKAGLIKGVSLGFRTAENGFELMKNGGLKFTDFEILELSLVAIPANASASIQSLKSYDAPHIAASGAADVAQQVKQPGVSGTPAVKARQERQPVKTIADQIKDFEGTRQSKNAEREALMNTAAEKGETLDGEGTEKYDALSTEIKSLDAHIVRMRDMEASNKEAAVEVKGKSTSEAVSSRAASVISVRANREPGIGMARLVIAQMAAYMERTKSGVSALDIAKARWPSDVEVHTHIKTNIAAGTTTETNWATELVEPTTLGSEFLEFLRAQTIIGKFGQNGVPSLRSLPFNIRIARMTSGLTGYWVGEGLGKPVSKGAVDAVSLPYNKVAALTVITKELARFSSPSAERVVRDDLARSVSARIDADFVDPAIAAVAGVKPASITNGLTALTSAGSTADNARTDIMNLIEYFILNHMDVSSLVLLMPNTLALALSIQRNSLGQQEFPGLTLNGGVLEGIPVITSQFLASGASYGNMVIAVSANDIGLADDGAVSVDVSGEATIEMTDTPLGDSATPTAGSTAYVSMFQTNSLAILAERFITWKKLRSTAAVYMDDVNWGAIGSPV